MCVFVCVLDFADNVRVELFVWPRDCRRLSLCLHVDAIASARVRFQEVVADSIAIATAGARLRDCSHLKASV